MKVIKRYQNRKLYDTSCSQYVDLVDIENYTLDGEIVQIIDSKTEEDITRLVQSKVVAKVYYEHGKKKVLEYLRMI